MPANYSKSGSLDQKNLKDAGGGDQLRALARGYKHMIKSPEGRRCWTLVYSETPSTMDILPSIVDSGYRIRSKSLSASATTDVATLACASPTKTDTRLPG